MKKIKIIAAVLAVITVMSVSGLSAFAKGNVTYSGDSGNFIFSPGSDYSPTDLFTDMKDVMPGDVIKQKITVRNDASEKVKVRIYMRSLGADEESRDFLSQLSLKVEGITDTVMFEAPADQSAQLTDWTYIGLIYSGGEADLNVTLTVPTSLGSEYVKKIGYLTWEFRVEEFPVEPEDPSPETGDGLRNVILLFVAVAVVFVIIIILVKKRKKDDEANDIEKDDQGNSDASGGALR